MRPAEIAPGSWYGKMRRKLRSLVTIVASIPKDVPRRKRPWTDDLVLAHLGHELVPAVQRRRDRAELGT
jgi:hypothetical protein